MSSSGRLVAFAPAPFLTVTVERATGGGDEVHLHVGGQGFWTARLAAELGAEVILCTSLGGESGFVVGRLLEAEPFVVDAAHVTAANGVYIHDRRSGNDTRRGDGTGVARSARGR